MQVLLSINWANGVTLVVECYKLLKHAYYSLFQQ